MFSYLFRNQRGRFAALIFLSILSCLFEVGLAYVMLRCVNFAMSGKLAGAGIYALGFAAYILVYFAVDYITHKCRYAVLRQAQIKLREDVSRGIFSLPCHRFHLRNTSGWLSVLTNQMEMIEESYFKMWFGLFAEIFEFVVSMAFLLWISPLLTLFILVLTGIQMLVPKFMSPRMAKCRESEAALAEAFSITAAEHLNGYDLLRSFQLTANSLQAIADANVQWENGKFKTHMTSALANLLSFTFGQVMYVGVYFFGALLTILGQMSVGSMIAASQLVVYIASPLQSISSDITEIRSVQTVIVNLKKQLERADSQKAGTENVPSNFKKLELRDVSFSYENHTVLHDVNLTIHAGKKYLLCGPSGSGKSTLSQLLTGALLPDQGEILVDGQDVRSFIPEQYARFILPCAQNTFLFNASFRDNVTLFEEGHSDEAVISAIQRVGLAPVLSRFPDGLNYILSQGGQSLSGGERQRLALARMELYDVPVVILDESFANLDAESAGQLLELVCANPKRTVILIAHQLPEHLVTRFSSRLIISENSIYEDVLYKYQR